MAKTFFVSEQQNLFPQHMFPARLNWETFASAAMFPSLVRPLQRMWLWSLSNRATTTPQIKGLIGLLSKNKRAARAARTYEQVRAVLCKTTT